MVSPTAVCALLLAIFGTLHEHRVGAQAVGAGAGAPAAGAGAGAPAAGTGAGAPAAGAGAGAPAAGAGAGAPAAGAGAGAPAAGAGAGAPAAGAGAGAPAAPANNTNATTTTARPTRPPWPKPNCGNPALTNEMRRVFLDMHNDFRGRLARGQTEASAGWGIAPPAALMYRMKYDCGAESYAQQSVASCRRTELPAYATGGYKQNLFVLNAAHTNPKAAINYALSQWWSQLARFGMRSNMMFYQSEYHRGARNVLKWAKGSLCQPARLPCRSGMFRLPTWSV
ncbi:hypothetical protein Y032_0038g3566 [Ancylostoma ceylanicum]|uniref:SCP domain-containing protein n=1 Tax=Ancylostoma ceylanicum TaxID=53326 RepID=A0A016UJI2_9BILA|nr:hypothetical protein Y032_0038g3566 [Ancylostoma ceylanicum]